MLRRCLCCVFIYFYIFLSFANAELKLIEPAKDVRYFEKDDQKRKLFYEERSKLVNSVLEEIKSLKQNKKNNELLEEAKILLQTLPLMWQKIETELTTHEAGVITDVSISDLSHPPYSIEIFKKFLDEGFQIKCEIDSLNEKIEYDQDELDRLDMALEQVYNDYLVYLHQSPDHPKTYLCFAEVLAFQARWALAKLNCMFDNDTRMMLQDLEKKWNNLFKHISKFIVVTNKDYKDADKKYVSLQSKYKEQQLKDINFKQKLEKNIAFVDINLIKASKNIKKMTKDVSSDKVSYLKVKKENSQTVLLILSEKDYISRLNLNNADIWRQWIKYYIAENKKGLLKVADNIENLLKNYRDKLSYIDTRLIYINQRHVFVESDLALHQKHLKKSSYYLSRLISEERDLLKHLDELQKLLQKEKINIKKFIYNSDPLIFICHTKAGTFEKLLVDLQNLYQQSHQTITTVLYYPLWNFGNTAFNLFILFKMLCTFIIGLFILKIIRRKLENFLINKIKVSHGSVNSISTLSYYILLCILILITLSSAGIDLSQIAIVFGALSVGIGFGMQTIANNFISGLLLLTERSIKIGDLVQLEDGTLGDVKKINIRSTVVRTYDGLEIIVPNSEFISKRISTWTYDDDWRRIRIPFGVAYGSDPEKIKHLAINCARQVNFTEEDKQHPIKVRFLGFGDNSLDFELTVWIRQRKVRKAMTGIKSEYYYALYQGLSEANIEIPFPQRDYHLRSIDKNCLSNIYKFIRFKDNKIE